jgi:branched-subunit amino acid transport protein AzlD
MLSIGQALLAAAAMTLIILGCRALPFLFFSRKAPPEALKFIEVYMPAIAMTVLTVSSYTSIAWPEAPHGIPQLVAGTGVVLLHVWKKNSLLSIAGGTAAFLLLQSLLLTR